MRITGLVALAVVMLAVIVTVAPKATVMTDEVSAEVYGIDFIGSPASTETQTAAAR